MALIMCRCGRQISDKAKFCPHCGFDPKQAINTDGFVIENGLLKEYKGKDKYVVIPENVTEICEEAFRYCKSLIGITIPESVKIIGAFAFVDCESLTSITIPESVTEIGGYAFFGCASLESITIPNSVTEISEDAFHDCTSLTSIIVEKANQNYASENGVLFNKDKTELICCPCGKEGSYSIPNSVTKIGGLAFDGCTSLKRINIPDGVIEIGECAFSNCTSLESITIPNSVTVIGGGAFPNCVSLASILVEKANQNYVSEDGVLLSKDKTKLVCCLGVKKGNYVVPDGVTEVGKSAFFCCKLLQSITIPDGVTKIGEYAFCNCESLQSINIPNSVTEIGDDAFKDCDLLTIYCNYGSYIEQYAEDNEIPANCSYSKNEIKAIENRIGILEVLRDTNIKEIINLNLIGKRIIHNSFGKGVIESQKGNIIHCNFDGDIKKFVFPDIIYQNFAYLEDKKIMSLFESVSKCKSEIEKNKIELQELKRRVYADSADDFDNANEGFRFYHEPPTDTEDDEITYDYDPDNDDLYINGERYC